MKYTLGVSQWREHGKKFGYWKYFKKEVMKEVIEEIRGMTPDMTKPRNQDSGSINYAQALSDVISKLKNDNS